MNKWQPFKLKQYEAIVDRSDVSEEYKTEIFRNEIETSIDRAFNSKIFVFLLEMMKTFIDNVETFKPFYMKHIIRGGKIFKDYESFVFDVVAAHLVKWDKYLDEIRQKGGGEYIDYIKRKANI